MMDHKKAALEFPTVETEVPTFLNTVKTNLTSELVARYGLPAAQISTLATLPETVKQSIEKAAADRAIAEASTTVKQGVIADARTFIFALFDDIRKHKNFLPEDGDKLQMFKTKPVFDPGEGKPLISKVTVGVQEVILDWVKGRYSGVVIFGSADGQSWTKMDKDMRSPFEDRRPWSAPEVRYYKKRYFLNDVEVGQESEVVKVALG